LGDIQLQEKIEDSNQNYCKRRNSDGKPDRGNPWTRDKEKDIHRFKIGGPFKKNIKGEIIEEIPESERPQKDHDDI
jgi:hypothetical protein